MKTIYKLLSVTLVGLVVFSGYAAASGGFGFAPVAGPSGQGNGVGDGTGPVQAADGDRPMDGSNSPWVTGDERLDRFQERFDLTDEQVAEIQAEVQALIDDGATRDEIRATVVSMLEEFGVDDPQLGPPADGGQGLGPYGQGHGQGNGHGNGPGAGPGNGHGPHGPADGSCQN